MTTFVDTSALLAILDGGDQRHREALETWRILVEADEPMVTTSYVLVESFALVQRRLGLAAVRSLERDLLPLIEVEWVEAELHGRATAILSAANRRDLSLVDCASFEAMHRRGVVQAFAFDRHFEEQGFGNVVSTPSRHPQG